MEKRNLRKEMPGTAQSVNELRAVFGDETVNAAIRKGMEGMPGGFHAEENGMEFGTRTNHRGTWVSLKDVILSKKEKRK